MPLDEGGGKGGRSKPVTRRKKPPPKPVSDQATVFGGNVGVFVPQALVPPPPIRNPDPNKAGAPPRFTVKATPQEQRRARELAEKTVQAQRVADAIKAPVDLDAKISLRATETETERKVRQNVALAPRPGKNLLEKVVDFDRSATGKVRSTIANTAKAVGEGVGTAFVEAAVGAATAAAGPDRNVGFGAQYELPDEVNATVSGAKAGLAPFVYTYAGPDLMNALSGLDHSRSGLLMDAALIPLAAGAAPIKAGRAGILAARAAKAGKSLEDIADIAEEAYRATRVAKVKPLSAAHGRALRTLAAKEKEIALAQESLATAKSGAAKDIEKAVERLKNERALAKQEVLQTRMRAQAQWPTLTAADPRFPARDTLARRLVKDYKGRKNALPPKASVRQMHDLITFLDEQTEAGQAGRMWYENSAEAIKSMAGGDPERAEKFAQLLAIYSPQQPIIGNTSLAIRAWNEFQHALGDFEQTGRVTTGQKWQQAAATKVMQGAGDWEGRKTNNFYVNFLEDINKPKFDKMVADGDIAHDGVTIDLWMARVFGYATDAASEGRYDVMESIVKLIAAERGWKPKQVQAAIWTAIKDASEDSAANIDFAEGIARHRGQFNWKSAPAAGDDFSATYLSWPEEVQQAFMTANAHLVDDFLTEVGILGERSSIGAGVYGGPHGVEFNPAAATPFFTSAAPRASGGSAYTLHPVERTAVTRAAAAVGQALRQESVAWIRPFKALSKGHADTVFLPLGRPMTSEEAQELYRLLNRVGERAAILHADTGVYLKNISGWSDAPIPNLAKSKGEEDFHGLVTRVANEVFPDAEGAPKLLASDGDLVESGDYGLHLTAAGDRAGSGADVRFQEAADRLASDAEVLRQRFAEFAGDVERAGRHVHFVDSSPREFLAARAANSRAWNLTELDARSLKGHTIRLSADGQTGFAVSPTGDLQNVFSNPGAVRGAGRQAVREAVAMHGAITLDAFDGFLPDYYRQFGFVETGRMRFVEEFAPAGMPPEVRATQPDIVFMALDATPSDSRYFDDWDEAKNLSAAAAKSYPGRGTEPLFKEKFRRLPDSHQLASERASQSWLQGLGQMLADERGMLSLEREARGLDATYEPRTLTVNDLVQQMPKARSGVTRLIENAADAISQAVDESIVEHLPGIRIVTASRRVAKQAGRIERQEIHRRPAVLEKHIKALADVEEGGLEDVAHFWYAQLPEGFRNADGLRFVRDAQKEELDSLTSGASLEALNERMAGIEAAMRGYTTEPSTVLEPGSMVRAADRNNIGRVVSVDGDTARVLFVNEAEGTQAVVELQGHQLTHLGKKVVAEEVGGGAETGSQAMRLLREREQVKILISDIPNRAQDVAASIARLDHLIEHAPPVNDDILDALRALADDRQKILVRAGRLDPERAAARKRLVSEGWLQLESDGSEIYMGHRLPREADSGRDVVAQVGAGTGRVGSPKGVGTKNRLVLATTGRVRASTRVALEDWSAGQVFETATNARDTLSKLGVPFKNHYREGYTLVNPKGRTIPPHWRTEELAQFSEGPEGIEEVRELAQDLVDSFAARNRADWDRIVEEAEEQGVHWSELRMVRSDLVDRYYSQFRSFKGRSTPAVAYDMAVDFFATSIIFARVGYIPKNIVQNLIMSVPHQGAFLPVNAARAGQVLADPELRGLLKVEVGFSGATQALSQESARKGPTKFLLGKVAGVVGSIADDPARISAFLHEAAAEGVISRVNPVLTEKDRKALVRLLTEKGQRDRLNDIRWRATEAMADFTRMTPDQARIARRFLIIPGWLMAGSRYPFHFAATHPIRSALIAYAVMGEPGAPEELQFNDPAWTYLKGKKYLQGIDTPWGRLRTSSLNPVTTPWELAVAAVGSIRGKEGPFDYDTPAIFDVANPVLSTGVEWAKGEGEADRTAKRMLPGAAFVKDMISPPEDPATYPEDVTRLGRLKREVGILPIEVIDEVEDDLIVKPSARPGSRRVAPRPGARGVAPRP